MATQASSTNSRSTSSDAAGSVRRAELLQLAAEMFAQRGYRATTVRDIAEQANILSGSLYHHFNSKEAMVDEILHAFLDDIVATYGAILERESNPRVQLETIVRESFRSVDEHWAAIAIFQKDGATLARSPRFSYLEDVARRIEQIWVDVLRRGVEAGEFRANLDQRLVYRFLRDTIWVAARWYRPDGAMSADAIADQYLSLVLDGFAVPTGKVTG